MRKLCWIGACMLAIGLSSQARAQSQALSAFSGYSPAQLQFTPIDVSKLLIAPVPITQQSSFSLLNFMPKISLPAFFTRQSPVTSPLPPASAYPSTHYKSAFTPMAPFTPGQ